MAARDPQVSGELHAPASKRFLEALSSGMMMIAACAVLIVAWRAYERLPPPPPQPAPLPTAPVSLVGAEVQGSPSAPIIMVVFSDFQCPFCHAFFRNTYKKLVDQYVTPGKVQMAFRHFPLSVHPLANAAARLARCAGEQGKFWEMHDQLFLSPTLSAETLRELPAAVGINAELAASCVNDSSTEAAIQADMESARALHFLGTPGFLLGPRSRPDSLIARKRISGALPLSAFQDAIDGMLSGVIQGK